MTLWCNTNLKPQESSVLTPPAKPPIPSDPGHLRSVWIWRCRLRLLRSILRPLRLSPWAGPMRRSSHWGRGRRSLLHSQPPASGRPAGGGRGQRPGAWAARPGCWGGWRPGAPAWRCTAQTGGLRAPAEVTVVVKLRVLILNSIFILWDLWTEV